MGGTRQRGGKTGLRGGGPTQGTTMATSSSFSRFLLGPPAAPVAKWAVRPHPARPPQECRGPPKHLQDVQRSAQGPDVRAGTREGHVMGQHLKPIYFASFQQMFKAADSWAQSRDMGSRNF